MAVSMRAVPALAVVLLASVFVVADDTQIKSEKKPSGAAAQPAAAKGEAKAAGEAKVAGEARPRAVRLTKPWRDLASLTDDQKRQINQIHRKAVQEIKAVEQREKDDIMALLNDQQKSELTALLEKEAAERKAKAAQRPPVKPAAGTGTSQKGAGADAAVAATEKAAAEKKSAD